LTIYPAAYLAPRRAQVKLNGLTLFG